MPYTRGSLLGNTKVCLRRNTLWASQRDAGVLNFRAEPEATALPEIKLQWVIEREPGAPLGSDPCALPENEEKVLPVFLWNKG